jgi:hypothetical protein
MALVSGKVVARGMGSGKGKGHRPEKVFTYVFKGEVLEVGDDYLVVDVVKGNKQGRTHLGEQTFAVTNATRIELDEVEGMDLGDVQVGMEANVQVQGPRQRYGVRGAQDLRRDP